MIAVIIQARMSSSRLWGKTLTEIAGEPMLGHVLRRARLIPRIDQIIIATTTNPVDVDIISFAKKSNVPFYVGSEHDVLDRFYQTAKHFGVSVIVRITPDCPLIDPEISSMMV
jgi:spore coat polysaccharide biosynthesis protein SpsF (cytidylyltransferase family)